MKKTFEEWKKEVDATLISLCNLSSDELPDWKYMSDYKAGIPAKRCAVRALNYAKSC